VKKKLLFLIDYYLPSYKTGGPIVSVSSLVELLGKDANIQIMTRCHDLGSTKTFSQVIPGEDKDVGKATVIYLKRRGYSFRALLKRINAYHPNVIYLNSVFSFHFSIKILILKKLRFFPSARIILASRGEFSQGALKNKPLKKKIFLFFAQLFNLYKDIVWQATSLYEKKDIEKIFGNNVKVCIALDLPRHPPSNIAEITKKINELRIVFLSRISPMKNLFYALDCLTVFCNTNKTIIFDIYGPKVDMPYWNRCVSVVQTLTDNVKVNYCGEVQPPKVHQRGS